MRILAVLAAALVAGVQACGLRHALTETYPYKMMTAADAYADVGSGGGAGGLVVAIGVAIHCARRSTWAAPLLGSLCVPAVCALLFALLVGVTSEPPGPGDFTPADGQQALVRDLGWSTLLGGGLAILASASLAAAGWLARRSRHAQRISKGN